MILFLHFLNILSSNVRIEVLSSISDLGWDYGSSSWGIYLMPINLSLSYDSAEYQALKENQR